MREPPKTRLVQEHVQAGPRLCAAAVSTETDSDCLCGSCLSGSCEDLWEVCDVVGDVAGEGVGQVLGEALDGSGAGHQRLSEETDKGNLRQQQISQG